jgi:hypothetical protein
VELRVNRTPGVPAAEQHLGDRMAAFVDGELDHEARERVQSHLATCAACLARAEEERRLKSRLQAATAPDPSGPLLSRLLAISVESGDDRGAPPSGSGSGGVGGQLVRGVFGGNSLGSGGAVFGSGLFGRGALGADHPVPGVDPRAERGMPFRAEQRPIAARMDRMSGVQGVEDRLRRPARPVEPARAAAAGSLARGRRFAFAAAGAFSVAAVALGGAVSGVTASGIPTEDPYGNVAPVSDTSGSTGGQFPDFGSRNGSRMVAAPLNAGSAADLANVLDAQHGSAPLAVSPTATPGVSASAQPMAGGRSR